MLKFDYPSLEDRKWIAPLLTASGGMGSEFAFGTLYLWSDTYHSKVCQHNGSLLLCSGEHGHTYVMPIGGDTHSAVEVLMADAQERGIPFQMWGVTEKGVEELEEAFPGVFAYHLDRDSSDYIYATEDLIQLTGRKYHGKRNHLSKFNRLYAWRYEDVTEQNLEDCRFIARQWCEQNGCGRENGLDSESCALNRAFRSYRELELSGGILYIEDKPAAFTIGEEINSQIFLLHFEKALSGYEGLYAAINHEFAARHLSGYQYVNREEDLGLEGLRKAKLSYYPAVLLQKYLVTRKDESYD